MNDSWVADPAMDCQVTLKPFIGDYDELKSIVLLGDSLMRRVFQTIHENPSCKLLRGGATGTGPCLFSLLPPCLPWHWPATAGLLLQLLLLFLLRLRW